MYHRIGSDGFDPWGLVVEPGRFSDQMAWLSNNRSVLPLTEFVARFSAGDLPNDAAAITFDDAYACTAELAVPELQRAGLPATIYLPAQLVEKGRPFWWDELQAIVLSAEANVLHLDGQAFALGDKRGDDGDWKPWSPPRTPRQSAFLSLWTALRSQSSTTLDHAMSSLRSQAPAPDLDPLKRPMSPAQVRSASAKGFHFGSHALTHPSLPHLTRAEKVREIGDSVERCAALSGHVPRTFAYPYGDFDEDSAKLVEEAGFEAACSAEGHCVDARSEVFALPRLGVGDWTWRRLARTLGST